jgi:hypothetical protein
MFKIDGMHVLSAVTILSATGLAVKQQSEIATGQDTVQI